MISPPNKQPTNAEVKFSKKRLALAFAIAGISDAIGAFATPLPPLVWVVDFATALLLFIVPGPAIAAVTRTGSGGDSRRWGASVVAAERASYRTAFTEAFGNGIAGEPLTMRFVDDRKRSPD